MAPVLPSLKQHPYAVLLSRVRYSENSNLRRFRSDLPPSVPVIQLERQRYYIAFSYVWHEREAHKPFICSTYKIVSGLGVGKLNHVAIAVPDLQQASNLYRDVMGAEVSAPAVRISLSSLLFFFFFLWRSCRLCPFAFGMLLTFIE